MKRGFFTHDGGVVNPSPFIYKFPSVAHKRKHKTRKALLKYAEKEHQKAQANKKCPWNSMTLILYKFISFSDPMSSG